MEKREYFNCPRCGLNYVEEKDEICTICRKLNVIREEFVIQYDSTAFCKKCHSKLDSKQNKICLVCKRLVCNCGACGCN